MSGNKFMLNRLLYFALIALLPTALGMTYLSFTYRPIEHRTVYVLPLNEDKPMKEYVLSVVASKGIDRRYVERLIQCESRWKTDVVSRTQDYGLWQISRIWHSEVSVECDLDFKCSTKEAIRIYKQSGNSFRQWSCNNIIN